MPRDFETYERQCKKIREENVGLLGDFKSWLHGKGLSEDTVKRHLENIDFYLDRYLLYDDAFSASDGVHYVDGFLGYWFIRKAMWASAAHIRANAASLKKFYTFMLEEKHLIENDDLDELKTEIKEMLPEWLDTLRRFDDPNIQDPDEIWGF